MIDSRYGLEDDDSGPEVVYVPSKRLEPRVTEVTVELRRTEDGRLAVLAYSSLQSLVECCGEAQPWVSLPPEKITEVVGESQADVVLWDAHLPGEQRRDTVASGGV